MNTQTETVRLQAGAQTTLFTRAGRRIRRFFANKRVVRYTLITTNTVLLAVIAIVVVADTATGQPATPSVASATSSATEASATPLDQLSSADIAANASLATNLPETTAVINEADSAQASLAIAPADSTVVAEPQSVSTGLKSRRDIQSYTVQSGDTVASIASKFNVTSNSIMWSNNISGNTVNAGAKLSIPPISGIVYTVQSGDTVASIASKFNANQNDIVAYNDAEISGIWTGEQIIIPNGQQQAPAVKVLSTTAIYGSYGSNGYDFGFCTWYVANRRAQVGKAVPSNLGNANTWAIIAASMGIATGATPQVDAVAVKHSAAPGHVAFVEQVNDDGSFWISEMNSYGQVSMADSTPHGGWDEVDWKLIPASEVGSYSYIY